MVRLKLLSPRADFALAPILSSDCFFCFPTYFITYFIFASVWLDIRTSTTVDEVLSKVRNKNAEHLKPICGLPISTYFSALKIKWLIDNVEGVRLAIKEDRCLFGTVDTWLIWVSTSLVLFLLF